MIDLGQAGQQKEGVRGTIPPQSIVKVRMEIRKPKKPDQQDPAVTIFKTGLKGLDCEFTVVSGQFEGVRIWENWFLLPGLQTITLTDGQRGICDGSMAKARAVVEAARNLDPADPSANRTIQFWSDMDGLEFPVKVGVDVPKHGDRYLNNNIIKVITPGDEHYTTVMGGGEVISDKPLPEIPPAPQSPVPPAVGNGGWPGAGGQTSAPPVNANPVVNVPRWAQAQQ